MNQDSEKMKRRFISFLSFYTKDRNVLDNVWDKIELAYSSSGRYYHTFSHLVKMFEVIAPYEHKLNHKESVWLAVWFHDVVYDTQRNDNEEKSAEFLREMASALNIPENVFRKAEELILLTKKHSISSEADFDSRLFLDADLAILGGTEEEYAVYMKGVRKEYSQYPDLLYREGRKKVLKHFLESEFLYKTENIRKHLEEKARINLSLELKQLSV